MSMQIVTPGQTRTRVRRSPSFPLAGTFKPFGLYPVMATPVLPGETMESFQMKRRVISMPIRHPLFGCWLETWLVYVKLTDIAPELATMFLSQDMATTGFTAGSSSDRFFVRAGQIDYLRLAVNKIWDHYFADESEKGVAPPTIDGVPLVKRRAYDWTHNLMFTPDDLVVEDLPSNPEGQLTGLDLATMMGMSELTYSKYLQQFGVSSQSAAVVQSAPEILRYTQGWVTPVNQIDPSSGAPSSAWAWSDDVTSDKAKRFDEPGFLICLQSARPKMLTDALRYSYLGNMWGFADFFPSYNLADPAAGIKQVMSDDPAFLDAFGPDGGSALGMLYDHRDILSRGEQFVNDWAGPYRLPTISTQRAPTDTTPVQTIRGLYPSEADVNAIWTEATAETPNDARRRFYYEGIASVTIRGHVKDTTL